MIRTSSFITRHVRDVTADLQKFGCRMLAALLFILCIPCSADVVAKLNTLYDLTPADYGNGVSFEVSPLVQAGDGNLYGVSPFGGAIGWGFVFKVSPSTGLLTHLHDFGFTDGARPRGALFVASDGFLYGTTESGGVNQGDYCAMGKMYPANGCGTVFRVGTDASFSKLHDFYSVADGYQASPDTGVVQATDGNFYGMAVRPYPTGTTSLFRMTPSGAVSPLILFPTDNSQGYLANAGLLAASDGYLYGTTSTGAAGACGTVFKAGTDGSFQTLHAFGGVNAAGDGCQPAAALMEARDGSFYGSTFEGGSGQGNCINGGCGTVYKITSSGTETVVHRFTGTAADGEFPEYEGLVQTADGTLYGTTGGNPSGIPGPPLCQLGVGNTFSCGTLYSIDTSGHFNQLEVFGNSDGSFGLFPQASLIVASDGNLYGTTFYGGRWEYGGVYRFVLNAGTPIVSIDSVSPAGGAPGTTVTLAGTGFTGATRLTFGGGGTALLSAPFVVVSDSQITTTVPTGAQTSAIGVTAPRGTTYSQALFYMKPVISTIKPPVGRVGSYVKLYGAHFDGLTSIVFGGGATTTDYTYLTDGDAAIEVRVPPHAKTGPITLTNPGGSAQSRVFTVVGAPGVAARVLP